MADEGAVLEDPALVRFASPNEYEEGKKSIKL
jgi:hypothetical protein